MSSTNFHRHLFQSMRGQPARRVATVASNYNTGDPVTYSVEWEPDHESWPRLAAYAAANPDEYDWAKVGDRWLVGWLGDRDGDRADHVVTLVLLAAGQPLLAHSTDPA